MASCSLVPLSPLRPLRYQPQLSSARLSEPPLNTADMSSLAVIIRRSHHVLSRLPSLNSTCTTCTYSVPLQRSALCRLPYTAGPRLFSSSSQPSTSLSQDPRNPPADFLDKKASLHELELVHRADLPQSLVTLTHYHRLVEQYERECQQPMPDEMRRQLLPYRYDVGHELKFDILHPPPLPPLDRGELGSGDYDRAMQELQKSPHDMIDPTGRTPVYSLMALEGVGYAVTARAATIAAVQFMAASADVLAQGSVEVDISHIAEGNTATVKWRGKPVFIRHRTPHEIDRARRDDELARNGQLRDPQLDEERVKREDYLIVVGICTHLGCVPLSGAGDFQGFFCPCHGSHYDTSARIRKGPAPLNLQVPPYEFVAPLKIKLGGTV